MSAREVTNVIKRIRMASRNTATSEQDFADALRSAAAEIKTAPVPARPVRAAVALAATDVDDKQKYDAVLLEWFTDDAHLDAFEHWLATDGGPATVDLSEVIDLAASPVVVTEENVGRGADWLDARWSDGGVRLKQMAIATRAEGLTLQQFLDMWKSRAGKVGAKPIPDAFKGQAYVQNHPRPTPGINWAYDAINEVYFDSHDDLLGRMDFFAHEMGEGQENDLVGASWFLALREEPV